MASNASTNGSGNGSTVQISDNPGQDRFLFTMNGGFDGSGFAVDISLSDTTGQAITGLNIPATLDLASFTQAQISYNSFDPSERFVGTITSLSLVPAGVPEPATWAMLLLGFGAAGCAMRRRGSVRITTRFA